jgi:hypothetical protein
MATATAANAADANFWEIALSLPIQTSSGETPVTAAEQIAPSP